MENNIKMDRVGVLWGQTWQMYRERLRGLMKIILIPALFLVLGEIAVRSGSVPAIGLGVIFIIAGAILAVFAYIAATISIHEKTNFNDSYRRSTQFFWPMVWVGILGTLVKIGGLVMLIVPGILFAIGLTLSFYVLILENRRGLGALMQSLAYVRGFEFEVFGRMLLLALCVMVPFWVIYTPALAIFGLTIGLLVYAVLMLFVVPFSLIYLYVMYRNFVAMKPDVAAGQAIRSKGWLTAAAIVGLVVPLILIVIFASAIAFFVRQNPQWQNPAYWQQMNQQQWNIQGIYPEPSGAPSSTATSSSPLGMHCGGFIRNAPTCPTGYRCQLDINRPDTGGVCVPD
ncbi:MAG: hypothetical protein KGJ13_01810 [Patescibacteria group bacterium]|nr:hypothetical protein [Patescibacteria group bacterium]